MRLIDQKTMNRLFAVTDDIPIDRESITVPLEMKGTGDIRRLDNGRVEITLPDVDDLSDFLSKLPAALRFD